MNATRSGYPVATGGISIRSRIEFCHSVSRPKTGSRRRRREGRDPTGRAFSPCRGSGQLQKEPPQNQRPVDRVTGSQRASPERSPGRCSSGAERGGQRSGEKQCSDDEADVGDGLPLPPERGGETCGSGIGGVASRWRERGTRTMAAIMSWHRPRSTSLVSARSLSGSLRASLAPIRGN